MPRPKSGGFVSNIPEIADLSDTAIEGILNDIAAQAEAYAKSNIIANDTVDTGFMLNATYGIKTDSDGQPGESTTMTSKDGQKVRRTSSTGPSTDKRTSAVGCGADYAIYVELDHPFIGPAGDQVEGDMDRIIAKHKLS